MPTYRTMKLKLYFTLYKKKLNSKWGKDLNIKPKIIQLLEVITRENLLSVRIGGGCGI